MIFIRITLTLRLVNRPGIQRSVRRIAKGYKDSLVKTITLVPGSVKIIFCISLDYINNNNRLDTVISPSAIQKVHLNKSSLSIKIFFCVLISALVINVWILSFTTMYCLSHLYTTYQLIRWNFLPKELYSLNRNMF